jgi:hypothetical protein
MPSFLSSLVGEGGEIEPGERDVSRRARRLILALTREPLTRFAASPLSTLSRTRAFTPVFDGLWGEGRSAVAELNPHGEEREAASRTMRPRRIRASSFETRAKCALLRMRDFHPAQ